MKRRSFLTLLATAPLLLKTGCKPADDKAGAPAPVKAFKPQDQVPAKHIQDTPSTDKSFRELEVSGSYRDIGQAIGEFIRDDVQLILSERQEWIESLMNITKRKDGADYAARLRSALTQLYPHYYEEVKGMAAGAGVSLPIMWAMSIKSELEAFSKMNSAENPGCSTIYYGNDKRQWLFHNEDGHKAYYDRMFVLKATPPSGVKYTSLVYPGLITGVGPGINSSGIAHTSNFIGCTKPEVGIPRYFLGRAVLEAKSLSEAINIVTTQGRAFPWHHNLLDCKKNIYISVETLPDGRENRFYPENIYIHTNHLVGQDTKDYSNQEMKYARKSSLPRYETLQALKSDANNRLTGPDQALTWLSSHNGQPYSPCRHPGPGVDGQTLATAYFNATSATMRLYKGNPCQSVPGGYYSDYLYDRNS